MVIIYLSNSVGPEQIGKQQQSRLNEIVFVNKMLLTVEYIQAYKTCYNFSKSIVEEPPPPLHRLATPISPGLDNDDCAKWLVMRAPDIPKG